MQATPRFGWSIDSQIQIQLDSRNAGQSNGGSCLDALIPSGSSEGPGRDGYFDAPCPLLGAPGIPSPGIAAKPVLGSEGCGSGQWAGRFELVSSWTGGLSRPAEQDRGEGVGNLSNRVCRWALLLFLT